MYPFQPLLHFETELAEQGRRRSGIIRLKFLCAEVSVCLFRGRRPKLLPGAYRQRISD